MSLATLPKNILKQVWSYDERRDIAVPGNKEKALEFCIEHFLAVANLAVEQRGKFTVALSGGSTPKALFQALASEAYRGRLDWSKVWLFWSDERAVPHDHPDSNYRMAMENGMGSLGIPKEQIFPMPTEKDLILGAKEYEKTLSKNVLNSKFDLVMLGMGDDGHTASLFPHTHGLNSVKRNVIANYLSDKGVWRMTLTYDCINKAHHIVVYVFGSGKADMIAKVLAGPFHPIEFPSQAVGVNDSKALWIADKDAASQILCV